MKAKGLLYTICLVGLFVSVIIDYFALGFNMEFVGALAPNITTTFLELVITILLVDKLLDIHKRKEERKVFKETIGRQYIAFVQVLSVQFINLVTKRPASFRGEPFKNEHIKQQIEGILNSLDSYIDENWFRQPIQVLIPNSNELKWSEQLVDYQVYMERFFKERLNKEITEFLGRFITILPDEIKLSIFKISDLLKSNLLVTPLQYGLKISMNNTRFEPNDIKMIMSDIGNEVIKLLDNCIEIDKTIK